MKRWARFVALQCNGLFPFLYRSQPVARRAGMSVDLASCLFWNLMGGDCLFLLPQHKND